MSKEMKNKEEKIEISHDINIFNFKSIINFCLEFGSDYNPTNEDLTLVNMMARWTQVGNMQKNYMEAVTEKKLAINSRQEIYKELKSRVRRAYNSLASTKEMESTKKDAKTLMKSITGDNVRRKRDKDGKFVKGTVSNSHLGFAEILGNFDRFINVLGLATYYSPQEDKLMVAKLRALYYQVDAANSQVDEKSAIAITVMITRDKGLYSKETGLVDVSLACKRYVRSLYGARSEEAMTVSRIKLKRLKRNV
jgi:hypothetical protein